MAGHETTTVEGGATTTLEMDCFYLNQLSDAMEKMGWVVAPKLMRHWFSQSPAHAFSEAEKKNIHQVIIQLRSLRNTLILILLKWNGSLKKIP